MNQMATLAGGCFWCTEAIFKRVKGVTAVVSGFSGGRRENPSYEQVASEATGHAESIQLTFNPSIIPYDKILDIFFATHDPTTKDRQGNDVGSEYRSVIFYHSQEQKIIAEAKIEALMREGVYSDPIVTELTPYESFYKAEDYHQNFYESGKRPEYCRVIIDPKIKKLLKEFAGEVKEEYL